MITYSVAQVEALTGIKAHTLRIWERRYDFLTPMRTPTNIRYYSDEQLKKLLNFGILVRNGYRVSKLNKMTDDQVYEEVNKVLASPDSEGSDEMKGLTLSMLEMNEADFDEIFERQVIRKGFFRTIIESIYPFLQYVGVLWTTNKAMIAQEHYMSNLIRQKIIAAIEKLAIPPKGAPSIVLFLLEGEEHEIGLLLASFMAKEMGWNVYYLGYGVPIMNIKKVVEIAEPNLLMTMFVTPKMQKINGFISSILEDCEVPFAISGSQENLDAVDDHDLVIRISSPHDFKDELYRIQKNL
ncbi:MerR family transcriptional regulator [Lutimonas zeaxanthinifaciens]|uniref:MerR family transcriptional regulator n=1 Tax=Lutimonas zeaxanthinifaciens TaxID=3060215 RepID=UPI00265CB228|nr:MerR family transcriptional regulator [Lutimonas sp. YSD2104]WKK65194.1 MerR family transcriptional regulator [Lutimonas sp. YSD2104]